jgi:hypothetical protein
VSAAAHFLMKTVSVSPELIVSGLLPAKGGTGDIRTKETVPSGVGFARSPHGGVGSFGSSTVATVTQSAASWTAAQFRAKVARIVVTTPSAD